jgi:ATP-dependent Clp protease protease subunit
MAASMGAVLLTAGAAGKRSVLPNSRVMIHQPLGGVQGQASDIEIEAREIVRIKKNLTQIIADHSGKSLEEVMDDSDRNKWMDAEEATDYGIVDRILTRDKK